MDKKKVLIHFKGKRQRRVRIGYILETPVWKISYRLVLNDKNSHFLQGWAIVENTTDEDWREVSLSLVSGQPISFRMDLYRPVYRPRPWVEVDIASVIQPQKCEDDLSYQAGKEKKAEPVREAPLMSRQAYGAGSQDYEEAESELDLARGMCAAAREEEVGEFFQYVIDHPVTLARQKSAMLPIVNQQIEGERVSIYNEQIHRKHPLHGLKLKNKTGLHLMAGPITEFEEGTYAGDARIDYLPAEAERTRDVYRFSVEVGPGGHGELLVAEEKKLDQSVALSNLRSELIKFYLRSRVVSERVKEALKKLTGLKAELADTTRELQLLENNIRQIHQEQERIRENMANLERDSRLYKRYLTILNDQEDELAGLMEMVETLRKRELQQKKDLDSYILSLELE